MYFETISQFAKALKQLIVMLDKAAAHAAEKKFDPNLYLHERLTLDMFSLTRQVQSVCDTAKASASRFSGREAPRHEDTEKTLDELRVRIGKCHDFLSTFQVEHFAEAGAQRITLPWLTGKYFRADEFLHQFAIPNFYFHLSMCYALLRRAGVNIGKMDFLGDIPTYPL